jgi:hypothetical protein
MMSMEIFDPLLHAFMHGSELMAIVFGILYFVTKGE